jgi:5-methylcytosine-specific restriction endonuclease McrA
MASVLLLNASYEPLAVITDRRAVSLIMKGRVEAACEEATELSSISIDLHVPVVMRLRHYVNVPQRGARWSRRAVLRRDRYTCAYCGIRPGELRRTYILSRQDFTVDHILPVSRGGRNSWGNTVCACWACNQRKGNRTPHEANMKLRWEPKRPRVNYLVASGEVPTVWRFYLEI